MLEIRRLGRKPLEASILPAEKRLKMPNNY